MKLKNIMNTYYGLRKENLEQKLNKIDYKLQDSNEDDITIPEAFLGGAIDGVRQGIIMNGVVYTVLGTVLLINNIVTGIKKD